MALNNNKSGKEVEEEVYEEAGHEYNLVLGEWFIIIIYTNELMFIYYYLYLIL